MYKWKIRFGELRDFYDEYGIAPVPSKEVALYQWARRQKMNTIRMSTRRQQIRTRRDKRLLEVLGSFMCMGNERL